MLQVKRFEGLNIENDINGFLSTIETDSVKGITWNEPMTIAVVQYEVREEWHGQMCGDCQHWDDSGSSSAVSGLCHECGGRRRFNCKACNRFKDVRD